MKKILKNFKSFGVKSFDINQGSIDVENRTITLSASSETPYMREDWDLGPYWEILGHNETEVDLSRLKNKAAFLYEHDQTRQIGVIEDVYLDQISKQIFAKVRFSKNQFANEVFQDIIDGIRSKISIGYKVLKAIITGYDADNIPLVRVVLWQPVEISSVSTPADDTVGVIRSISNEEQKRSIKIEIEIETEEDNMDDCCDIKEPEQTPQTPITPIGSEVPCLETPEYIEIKDQEQKNINQNVDNGNKIVDNTKNNLNIDIEIIDNKIKNNENIKNGVNNMNIQEIFKKADAFGVKDEVVNLFLKSGKTEEEFDNFVKEQNANKTKGMNMDQLGLSTQDKEIKEYNLFRAINGLITGRDCQELEISRDIAKKSGQELQGLALPLSFIKASAVKSLMSRAYNTASGNASGTENLVAEILDASNFVDILRPQLKSAQLGVRTVSGLVGDYAVPRKTSGMTNTWVGDSGASTESSAVFDKVVSKPKMLVSETQLFELALKQMTPDAQFLAMDDMIKARAVELDRVVFWGSGSSNQPSGVANTSGVNVISLGINGLAIARDNLIDLMSALGATDANVDNAKFVSNYKVKAALMKLKTDAGSGIFVWDEFKDMFQITNNIPSNLTKGTGTNLSGVIFGDFSDVCITEWGVPELIVDQYTLAKYGKVNIYMRQATDVLVRRPGSFSVIKDAIA